MKNYIFLHTVLMLQVLTTILSKMASYYNIFSLHFMILYGLMVFVLFIYAILWQKVLMVIPLSYAYINRAIVLVWIMIFGSIFWNECITIQKILGVLFIIAGLYTISFRGGRNV